VKHSARFGGAPPKKYGRNRAPFLRPLIPAWLDELRLPASEFRVLAHLWRRADTDGWSYPSVGSIGRICRLNEDTVWRVLRSLEERGLVARRKIPGRSNHLKVLTPTPHPPETEGLGAPETEGLDVAESEGRHLPETEGSEGIPSKVVQFAAPSSSELDDETHAAGSMKARRAHKPGTNAPACDPSLVPNEKPGVFDRDNSGQPARPRPPNWAPPPYLNGKQWCELTPADQWCCWQSIDPAHPAADYDGWPGYVAGRRAA
jgi:hypothetical protein